MQKNKIKILLLFLILLILCPLVFATGICQLDKEEYQPGEIATFFCYCNEGKEENELGYIVWQNLNGSILSSTSTSSGNCQDSFFGGSYLIPTDINFTGNVTFSENSNGTGEPNEWDNGDDIISDEFLVNGTNILRCKIIDITVPSFVNLGEENANIFKVTDATTGSPLIGASCVALAFSSDGSPILTEPYGKDTNFYKTIAEGVGYLNNEFFQERFEIDTTYEFKLYCQCLNNSDLGSVCYDDETGQRVGFKSCSVTGLFNVSGDDKRNIKSLDGKSVSIILGVIFLIIFFAIIGLMGVLHGEKIPLLYRKITATFGFAMAFIHVMILTSFIRSFYLNLDISITLTNIFYATLIISFGLGMIVLIVFTLQQLDSTDSQDNERYDKKRWERR